MRVLEEMHSAALTEGEEGGGLLATKRRGKKKGKKILEFRGPASVYLQFDERSVRARPEC